MIWKIIILIYMKSLIQFIKESQEIHESLIGDIVRKLLDTGLSWIEGSVKWIANKSADAVSDIWKTHRDVLTNTYSEFRRSHPEYKFLPEAPKTAEEYGTIHMTIYFNNSISADDKINLAETSIAKVKKRKGSQPGAIEAYIARETSQCYIGIIKNPKATASDKTKADTFLNKIKSENNDDVKFLIEDYIKDYKAHI